MDIFYWNTISLIVIRLLGFQSNIKVYSFKLMHLSTLYILKFQNLVLELVLYLNAQHFLINLNYSVYIKFVIIFYIYYKNL